MTVEEWRAGIREAGYPPLTDRQQGVIRALWHPRTQNAPPAATEGTPAMTGTATTGGRNEQRQ